MQVKKSVSAKALVILMVLVLLIGCGVGGTLAYLIAAPKSIENTFVAGDIGALELNETATEDINGDTKTQDYMVIPGVDIAKDPTISFEGHNVKAYVFASVGKVGANGWTVSTDGATFTNVGGGVTWNIATGWNYLDTDGDVAVYYQVVEKNAKLEDAPVIAGNKLTVSSTITQGKLDTDACEALTFTAYAIQFDGIATPTAAWTAVKAAVTP